MHKAHGLLKYVGSAEEVYQDTEIATERLSGIIQFSTLH